MAISLINRMVSLRENLMRIPERFGVPQVQTATVWFEVAGVANSRIIERCVLTKVKPFDITNLGSGLSVGADDVWAVVTRSQSLSMLNGTDVLYWVLTGIEDMPTKYRVAFIDDRELLTYKILLNRFYESR